VSPLNPIRDVLLCYVTDRRALGVPLGQATELLHGKIAAAGEAGVDWIQIREKDLLGRAVSNLAEGALRCVPEGCGVLVNDRLDVALAVGARGVHLGEKSLTVEEAKSLARVPTRSFVVGASTHSLETARAAEMAGADYIIFGPVFVTPSKTSYGAPLGIERLAEVCRRIAVPVLAIGGITLKNARTCLDAGARGIAAVRMFQGAADLPEVVGKLRQAWVEKDQSAFL
jgi:thiamine-phosphate diphosphorylase